MKSAILFPIIVAVVVVAAVAVIQVTGVNPFEKPSEGGVVETAITKLADAKRFKFNGKIEADLKLSDSSMEGDAVFAGLSSIKMFVNIASDVDQGKKGNVKTSSNINLGLDAEGMQLAGIIEAVTTGDNLYVKLVSIPPVLTAFLGDLEDIRNQWVVIDLEEVKEQYKEAAKQAGIELDAEQIDQQLDGLFVEMKGLLADKILFDITKEFGEEEVNEILTEHYFVTANKKAVKEFILEYVELTKKHVPQEQKAEYDESVKEAMKDFTSKFDEFWAGIGGVNFDIWVEKKTGRAVRIMWQKDIDPSGISDMSQEIESIGVKVELSFSDFNKSVDIEEPSGAKSLEEVLSTIMSTLVPQDFGAPSLP